MRRRSDTGSTPPHEEAWRPRLNLKLGFGVTLTRTISSQEWELAPMIRGLIPCDTLDVRMTSLDLLGGERDRESPLISTGPSAA